MIVSHLRHSRAFILWAVIALLWANLPYLVGYASSTAQKQFGGFFLYEQDGYSYYAKMRQGAQGAWEFHLPYTSEDEYQTGGIALMFYIVLGKLAPLGWSYPLLYHGARLLSSLLLLIVVAKFIARFVSDQRWQLWTWWLLLFSGGWGLLVSTFVNPKYVAYELIAPDAFVFSILYGPPHVILGYALLLIWIGYMLDTLSPATAARRLRVNGWPWRRIVIANLLGLLTALSREAYGPAFAGIFLAYLIALTVWRRKIPWRAASLVALSCLGAGLYGVYMVIAYHTIPSFIAWYQQNPFTSPDLLDFVLGFAPLILLAAAGLFLYFKRRVVRLNFLSSSVLIFLLAWLIAGPIMTYLPVAISRRLIAGWQIPLCIFGAYAVLCLLESKLPLRRVIAVGSLGLSALSTFIVIMGGTMLVTAKQPPLFQSADQLAALAWLGRHTTDRDVVLSDWRFGNQLPIYADARVFVGHPIETIGFKDKQGMVDHFFDPSTSDSDRQALIDRWKITLVVAHTGQVEPPDRSPMFQQGNLAIYRVTP